MQNGEFSNLVSRVTEEVLRQIGGGDAGDPSVIVIAPSYIGGGDRILKHLEKEYPHFALYSTGKQDTSIGYADMVVDAATEDVILGKINACETLVLVTPRVYQLENLVRNDDSGRLESLMMNALMWGKNISIIMDIAPPVLKNNAFYDKMAYIFGVLRGMGVLVTDNVSLSVMKSPPKGLLTEEDVLAARDRAKKEIWIAPGTIVTPLAMDAARELNIIIRK